MSSVIDNYLELARAAKNAGNNAQCEQYCNRILELENNNAVAWALKGSAAGWQSSLAAPRIEEMLVCYGSAINYAANADLANTFKEMASMDYMNVVVALFDLQCDRFTKWPDQEEVAAFMNLYKQVLAAGLNMWKRSGVLLQCMNDSKELNEILAVKINNSAIAAERAVRQEYETANDGYPLQYDFQQLISREGQCFNLLQFATTLDESRDGNIEIWRNMIRNHEYCMSACSYKWYIGDYSGYYLKDLTLTAGAVRLRKDEIAKLNEKISEAQERIRQRKNDAYWAVHAEEKNKLETERNELADERERLEKERACSEQSDGLRQVQKEIRKLEMHKASLSFFALRERKELNAQIAEKQAALEKLQSTLLEPIDERLQQIDERIQWIINELTRDR